MERRNWDARSPKVGERAHDFEVLDETGKATRLSRLVSAGPLVLLFLRSHEDPVCLRQLLEYRDATLTFRKQGASIVAVLVAEPVQLAWLRHERGIGYSLLADPERRATEAWGLLDRGDHGGGASHPATFVLGKDRVVKLRALDAPARRTSADAVAQFIRRGGAGARRGARIAARLQRLLERLHGVLRPARLVR
jgi:peroxiredoxin Q/BCP